jgi:hypothetical protein
VLTDLHESLEEFSFSRQLDNEQPEAYYTQTAAALIDVLRRCPRLRKVSLTTDTLRSVNVQRLLPYGDLFHELDFNSEGRTNADKQAIADLLVNCSNLRKFCYEGCGDGEDSPVLTAIRQSCPPLLEELGFLGLAFDQQGQIAGAGISTFINRGCRQLRKLSFRICDLSVSAFRSIARVESLTELTLDDCSGITDAAMATLATMKLVKLSIDDLERHDWTEASLQSFVGSNISQTLETFHLRAYDNTAPINDVLVATALASCHNLKKLTVCLGDDVESLFGHNGLDGLQAMARGCPLLANVTLYLTASGVHCLGAHCPNLKECLVFWRDTGAWWAPPPKEFPSVEELRTLYPAVKWDYECP